MNKTYLEFMKEKINKNYENYYDDVENIGITSHGSDKESFKQSYEDNYKREGVKIYHKDNPKIFRFGFVIVKGDFKIWHTVRINAWKSYDNLRKEILGE